jgi:hypothetical protein
MRNSVIIVLTAIVLLAEALAAHAEVGGPGTQPAVGTANPAPPAAGSDVGAPLPQKPALTGKSALGTNGNVGDNQGVGQATTGADTSTAAPGGHAESSANGALSTPSDGTPIHPDHRQKKPAIENSDNSSK